MTTAVIAAVLVAALGLVLAAAVRGWRRVGAAEQRVEDLEHVVKDAENIADAQAGAPRTVDDLDKRLQSGGHL